jgi:hypothetical protein
MSSITMDQQSAAALRKCGGITVLCDADGHPIGYFQPVEPKYDPRHIPEFDEAELDRRQQDWKNAIPSAEVRRRLEELR